MRKSMSKSDSLEGRAAVAFHNEAIEALGQLKILQLENIVAAARVCAESIAQGGLVFLFGAGHSRMMVDEMTPRQGCFVGFYPLVELSVTNYSGIIGANGLRTALYLEKYEGLTEQVLESFRFGPHDSFIIISTSGIRPLLVEMALGGESAQAACHRDRVARSLRVSPGCALFWQETHRGCGYRDRQSRADWRLRRGVTGA